MAKELAALMNTREHMVINQNTSGTSEHVASYMKDSAWTGELVVQLKDDDASLWTLAKDNETAIEFVSKTVIEKLTEVTVSTDTYMSAAVDNHAIKLETNVVDSVEEFSDSTELGGKLVDADVIKTIIEVSAATKDIATSTQLGQGHADAYDVKTFALNDVDTTDSATTSNVRVVSIDGLRKLDFSRMVIDCGSF